MEFWKKLPKGKVLQIGFPHNFLDFSPFLSILINFLNPKIDISFMILIQISFQIMKTSNKEIRFLFNYLHVHILIENVRGSPLDRINSNHFEKHLNKT
jgi:hypothetical protein